MNYSQKHLFQTIGAQPFYGKGPHLLWWASMLAARRNINYCVICIVYTSFTNVPDGPIIQQGGWHATHVLKFTGRKRENEGLKVHPYRKRT